MPRIEKKTQLTELEHMELEEWLKKNNVDTTRLRRSFTDVLPLARLLARYYPDLVDVNVYPPRNSVRLKLSNWQLFRKRVLKQLGVNVTEEEMNNVVRCIPGSIDVVLYNVMRAHENANERRRSCLKPVAPCTKKQRALRTSEQPRRSNFHVTFNLPIFSEEEEVINA